MTRGWEDQGTCVCRPGKRENMSIQSYSIVMESYQWLAVSKIKLNTQVEGRMFRSPMTTTGTSGSVRGLLRFR